jgi:UDP:flavonoid glycosyltransferase YjiC (YdhE family)
VTDTAARGKRIVLTAVGSLGDLHPSIAIGLGLKARGHDVVIATGEAFRPKITALGLGYRPLRPDSDMLDDPATMGHYMNLRFGTERVLREWILPVLRDSYEDTIAAAEGVDLLVAHATTFATRLVAEKTGIPWVSTMVTPVGFFSVHDPPLLPGFPEVTRCLRFLGPAFWGPLGRSLKWLSRHWAKPWYAFRKELGLPPTNEPNPLVDGQSPLLHLALFSPHLAAKQPDWPVQTVVTGFPIFDGHGEAGLPSDLSRFLDEGPPPIVFTLGSSAAAIAGRFYEHSVSAASRLGRRAVLILGDPEIKPPSLPPGMVALPYAPFSKLFPRAVAIVYPGGVGSTGLAMGAGRPMVVVPHAHDQPDNAARLTRMGVARTIYRRRYTAARAVSELGRLLDDPEYTKRAARVQELIAQEDGVKAACDALESIL